MKKKTLANIVMVAIIVIIAAAGILGVGYIQGWFDTTDGMQAYLAQVSGVVQLEREGVAYPVGSDTVLRAGDQLHCQAGATAVIRVGSDTLTLGESAALVVREPSAADFQAEITSGEVFVNTENAVKLSFGEKQVTLSKTVAHVSVRSGSQSVSVFAGSAGDASAGQILNYIGNKVSVQTLDITSLNDFVLAQVRIVNQTKTLCFTNTQLDKLEQDRNDALQDIINGQIPTLPEDPTEPPVHVHSYVDTIIAPTCLVQGHTMHTCVCGDTYTDTVTNAIGHNWSDWVTTKEPTTETEGVQTRECDRCHEKEQSRIAKLPAAHVHAYTQKTVAVTCTADGYTLYSCACGSSYKDQIVKAQGHVYEDKVSAPSCTEQGYTTHTCACGDSYKDSFVAATDHLWGDWVTTKEPTTTQEGTKERTCQNCTAQEQGTVAKLPDGPPIAGYVNMTIRCDTIVDNMEYLNPAKAEFVPADGVIMPMLKVYFYEGETAFDVLKRACESLNIQLEYSWTPMFETYYIEGINNLYEKDVGLDSGWMFKVNEWFPDKGCSALLVKDGDVIEWLYTCIGYGTDIGAPEWEG